MQNDHMNIVLPYPPAANASPRARRLKILYCSDCRKLLKGIRPDARSIYMAVRFFPKNRNTRGDLDNLIKTLLDALKGFAFSDDSQVCAMYILMMDSDKFNPRVEVRIAPYKPSQNNRKEIFK